MSTAVLFAIALSFTSPDNIEAPPPQSVYCFEAWYPDGSLHEGCFEGDSGVDLDMLAWQVAYMLGAEVVYVWEEPDMAAIRAELSRLKAALGAARSEEAFWRQEVIEGKQARRSSNDLARGS